MNSPINCSFKPVKLLFLQRIVLLMIVATLQVIETIIFILNTAFDIIDRSILLSNFSHQVFIVLHLQKVAFNLKGWSHSTICEEADCYTSCSLQSQRPILGASRISHLRWSCQCRPSRNPSYTQWFAAAGRRVWEQCVVNMLDCSECSR